MRNDLAPLYHNLLPGWRRNCQPDPGHPHRRRYTKNYKRKRCIVRNCWIVGGALAAINATLSVVLAIGLATTFLSFMLLDESQ